MQLGFSQNLEPSLNVELEHLLSPRQILMLKTLQLPYQEAVDYLHQEAENNVLLEIEKEDQLAEYLRFLGSHKKERKNIDFQELPGMENVKEACETLEQFLLHQLELADLEAPIKALVLRLIENVDDQGYLLAYPEVQEKLVKKMGTTRETVDEALEILQSFEPEGVGARNLKECLLIQIREYNFESAELRELLTKAVTNYLEDLGAGNFSKVADELGLTSEGTKNLASFIKNNLTPYPGSRFGEKACAVIPSFSFEKTDSGSKLTNLEEKYGPQLGLSDTYLKMLDDPKTNAETLKFLKEKLQAAKAIIENWNNRKATINKILEIIAAEQGAFVDKGKGWLKPLLQKDLADKLGVHPSTICRALAGKYVQTPHGVYPLKFMCARDFSGKSSHALKRRLAEIISGEDRSQPLKDAKISALFQAEGIKVERRTIAAYRKHLGIPNAKSRKTKK